MLAIAISDYALIDTSPEPEEMIPLQEREIGPVPCRFDIPASVIFAERPASVFIP